MRSCTLWTVTGAPPLTCRTTSGAGCPACAAADSAIAGAMTFRAEMNFRVTLDFSAGVRTLTVSRSWEATLCRKWATRSRGFMVFPSMSQGLAYERRSLAFVAKDRVVVKHAARLIHEKNQQAGLALDQLCSSPVKRSTRLAQLVNRIALARHQQHIVFELNLDFRSLFVGNRGGEMRAEHQGQGVAFALDVLIAQAVGDQGIGKGRDLRKGAHGLSIVVKLDC